MNNGSFSRTLGKLLLLLGICAGVTLVAVRDKLMRPPDLRPIASSLASRAAAALDSKLKPFEATALEAAGIPELSAAFENTVDAATFQDAIDSEDWWKPFRGDGRVSAVWAGGKVMASSFFEKPAPAALDALVAGLSKGHAVTGLVKGDGRIYAVGAARIEHSPKAAEKNAVVVIAKPLTETTLAEATNMVGAALGLSDGTRVLLAAGPAPAAQSLSALAGKEKLGPSLTPDGLPAVASDLGGGLWLWVVGTVAGQNGETSPLTAYAPIGLAGLLVLIGAVLLLLRPPADPQLLQSGPSSTGLVTSVARAPAPIAASTSPESGDRGSAEMGHRPTMMAASGSPAPAAAAVDARPNVLGRYTLLDKIGEGGMAEVFRATLFGAEGFQRQLVVKRLHSALTTNKEAVAQFIDEARLQSGLVHSNIVPVFDFGRAGQDYFLALEYIEGKDLDKTVQRHVELYGRALPLPLAAFIVHEVLTALEFAHTRTEKDGRRMEIVHRDVSLGNVLLSFQGEVKLSDFGIVKAERRVSKTQLGMVKGNTGFMSPEQARGEPVDARADVFSAGVVMYCCLTGLGLYQTDNPTPMNQLLRAAVGPDQTQFQKLQTLSPEVAQVINRAIAADAKLRFASAGDFARALRPFVTASREDLAKTLRDLFADDLQREYQ